MSVCFLLTNTGKGIKNFGKFRVEVNMSGPGPESCSGDFESSSAHSYNFPNKEFPAFSHIFPASFWYGFWFLFITRKCFWIMRLDYPWQARYYLTPAMFRNWIRNSCGWSCNSLEFEWEPQPGQKFCWGGRVFSQSSQNFSISAEIFWVQPHFSVSEIFRRMTKFFISAEFFSIFSWSS